MKLVCRKNGSNVTNFTDGKIYPATERLNKLIVVTDDRGVPRYVLPDEPSPHLIKYTAGSNDHEVVGVFEIIPEEQVAEHSDKS